MKINTVFFSMLLSFYILVSSVANATVYDFEEATWQNHQLLVMPIITDDLQISILPNTGKVKAVTAPNAIYPGFDKNFAVAQLIIEPQTLTKQLQINSLQLTDLFQMSQPQVHIRGYRNDQLISDTSYDNLWLASTGLGPVIELASFSGMDKWVISNETDSNASDIYFFLETLDYQLVDQYQSPQIISASEIQLSSSKQVTLSLDLFQVTGGASVYPDGFSLEILVSAESNYTVTGSTVTIKQNVVGEVLVAVRVFDGTDNSNIFDLKIIVQDETSSSSSSSSSSSGASTSSSSGSSSGVSSSSSSGSSTGSSSGASSSSSSGSSTGSSSSSSSSSSSGGSSSSSSSGGSPAEEPDNNASKSSSGGHLHWLFLLIVAGLFFRRFKA